MRNVTAIKNTGLEFILSEIAIDNENYDFRFIAEYEIILGALKRIFGNHEAVLEIEDALDELKESGKDCRAFDAIKMETLASTGDEYLAEDVAWELVYG